MFSIRLASGKEASFEKAEDLYNWYQKEKRSAITPNIKKDNKDKNNKEKVLQDS